MGGTPVVERLRFATCDPGEGLEVMERVYAVRQMHLPHGAPFSIAQQAAGIEKVGLERARITGAPASALVEAPGTVRIGQVLGGRLTVTEKSSAARGAVPFLFPCRPYVGRWGDIDLLTVSVQEQALHDHAAGLVGAEGFRVRFTAAQPVSAAMARYLAAAVRAFGRDQLNNEEAMAFPLVRAEAFRRLATAVLLAFPGTFLDQQATGTSERPAPNAVARAVAFMGEHLGEDIGLAQIAAAARMSPRGLQVAFRREKDTTPMAHLRFLRLEAARADLQAADPTQGDTVAAVAARWGFTHLGHFAAAYRERYGQAPATTLRT